MEEDLKAKTNSDSRKEDPSYLFHEGKNTKLLKSFIF